MLTREYPPDVYGGAGVHVEYLARELAKLAAVEVRTFGLHDIEAGSLVVQGHGGAAETVAPPEGTYPYAPVVRALRICLSLGVRPTDAEIVHSHTWYAALGGLLARLIHGIPLVVTAHSIEPLRPWKREQLGRGADVSAWAERAAIEAADAVIAVSAEMRRRPSPPLHDRARAGARHPERSRHRHLPPGGRPCANRAVRDRPGAPLRALRGPDLPAEGSPPPDPGDPEPRPGSPGRAVRRGARHARHRAGGRDRGGARPGGAAGSRVDPRDGRSSHRRGALLARGRLLLPVGVRAVRPDQPRGDGLRDPRGRDHGRRHSGGRGRRRDRPARSRRAGRERRHRRPRDPARFERDLAQALNALLADPSLRRTMGIKGRQRAEAFFSWTAVARRTLALYRTLVAQPREGA